MRSLSRVVRGARAGSRTASSRCAVEVVEMGVGAKLVGDERRQLSQAGARKICKRARTGNSERASDEERAPERRSVCARNGDDDDAVQSRVG